MKKNVKVINIPTVFTALNLFSGFMAAVLTAAGNFVNAAWFIFFAAVFDSLDGRIARASGNSSEFGLQMDSLSDVVSSGLAPSLIIYEFHLKAFGHIGLILSFLPLLFSAFRLARFNVFTAKFGKQNDYVGLPAPMAAVTLASLVIFYYHTQWQFLLRMLVVLAPLVSLLMISTLKYDGFPVFSFKEKGANRIKLIIFFTVLVLFIFFPHFVLFPFMIVYLLYSPIRMLARMFKNEEQEIAFIPDEEEQIVPNKK